MPDTLAFWPGIAEQLGHYVYALRDPRPGRGIFYVGKGIRERVYQHVHEALKEPDESEQSLKIDTIREIHREGREVGVEIIRHCLPTEAEAYEVEAGVIDALRLTGAALTNKVVGRHRARGWHSLDELRALYEAKLLEPVPESDRLILMKITRLYRPGMSEAELYEITWGWWDCSPQRHGPNLALAVYDGIVRAVYRIHEWEIAAGDEGKRRPRRGFKGEIASDKVDQYVWRSVRHIVGGSNPIQYHNC
jgi:hypothetical protein